jgi:glyoxylase-like metal-dependent hydrolase (beta-lactamase superfamily II)
VSTSHSGLVTPVGRGIYLIRDTCNVYLIEAETPGSAITIDFGSGSVLEAARELGLTVTDVLMTHHHRDQAQGLPLAVEAGIRIHVPPVELELFRNVEEMWQSTRTANNYNLRQERFSLLESVPVASTVPEYRERDFGGVQVLTLPTPGHTVGSVSYLIERDGSTLAFTGDLIYAPGKVWSLAATQWSYTGQEGPAMTVLSSLLLADAAPDILYPSHGNPMAGVGPLTELAAVMQEYVDSRRSYPWDLTDRLRNPFRPISDHLLLNRSSMSCSYVLLSETGEALLVDFGYDMTTGILNETERAARRPWLASLPALRDQYGVSAITVGLPTHYHDDHLAGFPLLRDVEGTELWIPANFAQVLAEPTNYDLPCLWFEPIAADRVLPVDETFRWNEYTITPHELPGHTLYAVAYEVEVDGVTVLFTGDQQESLGGPGERRDIMNYQYRNRFALGDYARSAALYERIAPGLFATGHWEPRRPDRAYLDYLVDEGRFVDDIHYRLLPLGEYAIPADGTVARISPFYSRLVIRETAGFVVAVTNPLDAAAIATVSLIGPDGWAIAPSSRSALLQPGEWQEFRFAVTAGPVPRRHARIAADVTIGELRLGQHTEAVIDVGTKP